MSSYAVPRFSRKIWSDLASYIIFQSWLTQVIVGLLDVDCLYPGYQIIILGWW